jgi:cytoskeletal protein RodZ
LDQSIDASSLTEDKPDMGKLAQADLPNKGRDLFTPLLLVLLLGLLAAIAMLGWIAALGWAAIRLATRAFG